MMAYLIGILMGLLGFISPLYAHNCGSLNDCFGTMQAATGVGVGIAVMMVVGWLFDFFPNLNVNVVKREGDDLVLNSGVRAEIEMALQESGDYIKPEKDVREQGGWIIRKNGRLGVQRVAAGTSSSLVFYLPAPPDAVGAFHTHPYGHDVSIIHGPGSADVDFSSRTNLPHFIIDRQSIMRVHPTGGFHDVISR